MCVRGGKSGIFMHVYSQTFRPNDLGIHLFLIVRSKSLKRANLSEGNNKPSAFEMCQKTNRRWSLSATLLAMGSKEMGTRGWDVSLFPFYFIIWIFKSKYLANHLSKLWTVFTWISRSEIFKLDPILICFDKLFTEFPKLLRLYLSSSATCIQVFIELYLCFLLYFARTWMFPKLPRLHSDFSATYTWVSLTFTYSKFNSIANRWL
jgi:hypothetical protein